MAGEAPIAVWLDGLQARRVAGALVVSDITFWIVVALAILGGAVGGAFATWVYLAAEEEQGWRERRREAAQDELWANFYATADDLFGNQQPPHWHGPWEAR